MPMLNEKLYYIFYVIQIQSNFSVIWQIYKNKEKF